VITLEDLTMEDKKTFSEKALKFLAPNLFAKMNSQPTANFSGSYGTYTHLFSVFNGEKNLGEVGPIKNYMLDYAGLRMRSWQSYHESEITQTILNRYNVWVIGTGLKLQVEPVKAILESEGISLEYQKFAKVVESRFHVWSKSKNSDYSNMRNLSFIAAEAFKNTLLGGDVLVLLRYNNGVSVQLIDGAHIQSPAFGTEWYPQTLDNGNKLINGIECDASGRHIRYYIRQRDFSFKVVEAFGVNSGMQMAFMCYGIKYRLDNVRGVPLFSVVLESLKKMERYKEATVGSAEERQKIIMQVVHKEFSTGENPQNKNLAKAYEWNGNGGADSVPIDVQGTQLANTVTASTNKQTYNMPVGSELKTLESKNELYFKDFYTINFDIICAAVGIPPNVASSKYDSNFSASRAALKDWEHTLKVKRYEFAFQFYQPIYDFWLECEILLNKIQAPGYVTALSNNNSMVLNAYRGCRFVGAPVPHIDPLKEVKAEREKLGTTGATLPLTTLEAATEALGGGESEHNMMQYADELEDSRELGILGLPDPVIEEKEIEED